MIRPTRRGDRPTEEIELLDAEIFEVPHRLSLDEARDHSGAPHDPYLFNADDLGDDR
ncbi:hypothetical protein BH10PSE1_BH10PSE1_26710 [soil metagenome]